MLRLEQTVAFSHHRPITTDLHQNHQIYGRIAGGHPIHLNKSLHKTKRHTVPVPLAPRMNPATLFSPTVQWWCCWFSNTTAAVASTKTTPQIRTLMRKKFSNESR